MSDTVKLENQRDLLAPQTENRFTLILNKCNWSITYTDYFFSFPGGGGERMLSEDVYMIEKWKKFADFIDVLCILQLNFQEQERVQLNSATM